MHLKDLEKIKSPGIRKHLKGLCFIIPNRDLTYLPLDYNSYLTRKLITQKKLIIIFKDSLENIEKFLFKMLAKSILTQSQVLQIVRQNMPKKQIHIFNYNMKKIRFYNILSIESLTSKIKTQLYVVNLRLGHS